MISKVLSGRGSHILIHRVSVLCRTTDNRLHVTSKTHNLDNDLGEVTRNDDNERNVYAAKRNRLAAPHPEPSDRNIHSTTRHPSNTIPPPAPVMSSVDYVPIPPPQPRSNAGPPNLTVEQEDMYNKVHGHFTKDGYTLPKRKVSSRKRRNSGWCVTPITVSLCSEMLMVFVISRATNVC